MSSRKIYANKKQQEFIRKLHPVKTIVASRGFGKSHFIGWSSAQKAEALPGSSGLLTCKTIEQIKSKTLPVIESVWNKMGMKEGYHYTKFKKKPMYYAPTIRLPEGDDNVYFCNGAVMSIVSSKQANGARGGSYDWVENDEAAFFKEDFFDDIIIPSVRGNIGKWLITPEEFCTRYKYPIDEFNAFFKSANFKQLIKHPFHHQINVYTSPPRSIEGQWIWKLEKLAETDPDEFAFMDADVYDNIDAFGRDNLARAKKIMKKKAFDAEFGTVKNPQSDVMFYFAYNKDVQEFDQVNFTTGQDGKLYQEGFSLNPLKPIDLTIDFSGWFTGATISQQVAPITEVLHDQLYVLQDGSIDDLIDLFCNKYEHHLNKFVLVYGEPRGHDRTAYGTTIYQSVEKRLRYHGWRYTVRVKPGTQSDEHIIRHQNMNEMLQETNPVLPKLRINKKTCPDVIRAIELTEVLSTFQKNKKAEKNRAYPQQHAPHFTDMLDYLFTQKHGHRFNSNKLLGTGIEYKIQ